MAVYCKMSDEYRKFRDEMETRKTEMKKQKKYAYTQDVSKYYKYQTFVLSDESKFDIEEMIDIGNGWYRQPKVWYTDIKTVYLVNAEKKKVVKIFFSGTDEEWEVLEYTGFFMRFEIQLMTRIDAMCNSDKHCINTNKPKRKMTIIRREIDDD